MRKQGKSLLALGKKPSYGASYTMKQSAENEFLSAYDTYADAIFRFCYAQTSEREVALDLTQETFVRTWKHLAQGNVIEQVRPFLYRIARNAIIDRHRRDRTDSLDTMTDAGFDVEDQRSPSPLQSAQVSEVIRLASTLDPKYREAVLLRYIDELPPREIAQVIGESENTISVRIHRGMEQLRKLMEIDV